MHQVLGIIGWFSNMHVINYGAYAAFKRFYRIRQACVCVCVCVKHCGWFCYM